MYFGTKSYLKSTRNHTTKHALNAISDHVYERNLLAQQLFFRNEMTTSAKES
jgi:hypothetical protein